MEVHRAQHPSIVVIVTDQQALHTLSCYGAPVARSPQVDALAADGVRFDRAYTPCPLCTPARASLLTGCYPHQHGVLFNTGVFSRFDEEAHGAGLELFPQRLASQGYALGHQGKWHAGITPTAAEAGFEGFSLRDYGGIRGDSQFHAYLKEGGLTFPRPHFEFVAEGGDPLRSGGNTSGWVEGDVRSSPCHFVAEKTLAQLETFAARKAPFFLECHFWEPHAPYLPTEDFKSLYDPREIVEWGSFRDDLEGRPAWYRRFREEVFRGAAAASWEVWAQVIARYYAQARMVDFQVGRIVEKLRELELYDDTWIVFTSDHGESAGIHGGFFDKGGVAFEELYHIPLVVKPPKALEVEPSSVSSAWVSLIDLAPTFCEIADTSLPSAQGQSLVSLLSGEAEAEWRDDMLAEDHGHRVMFAQRILWYEDWKYVFNPADRDELYHLKVDPDELYNRIDDPLAAFWRKELRARLKSQLILTGDRLGPQWRQLLQD